MFRPILRTGALRGRVTGLGHVAWVGAGLVMACVRAELAYVCQAARLLAAAGPVAS